MPKMPNPTKQKGLPVGTEDIKETPVETEQINKTPKKTPTKTEVPKETSKKEEIPQESPEKEEMPSDKPEDNCVEINGKKIEIKPTKLKYFRNKTASAYNLLKTYPLSDVIIMGKGIVDEYRDGDQVVYDFLVAAFDNAEFVREVYNDIDADQVEKIVTIMGRLNHIDEKIEAQRKNREAQAKR